MSQNTTVYAESSAGPIVAHQETATAQTTTIHSSANGTPAPLRPKQSLLLKISGYLVSGSSSLISDPWFHKNLASPNNLAPLFERNYQAAELQGHIPFITQSPHLQNFVFLYVPGLYSGKHPWSEHKAGVRSKHEERITELRRLGLDARLVPVPNDGTVASNSDVIVAMVHQIREETPKDIVLVGYSKGGVDVAAALAKAPELLSCVRAFITLFSPLYGSHIASDIMDSSLRGLFYLGIKNVMDCDTEAMKDLSFERRERYLRRHPLDARIPTLSLAAAITSSAKTSYFQMPYKYILSHYSQESDGLVACKDAIYPGANFVLLSGMDHIGPHAEYPMFRNHISFLLAAFETALDTTSDKWATFHQSLVPPPLPPHPVSVATDAIFSSPEPVTDHSTLIQPNPTPTESVAPRMITDFETNYSLGSSDDPFGFAFAKTSEQGNDQTLRADAISVSQRSSPSASEAELATVTITLPSPHDDLEGHVKPQ